MRILAALITLIATTILAAGGAGAATVYSNNFETGSTAGFSGANGYTPVIVAAPNASTSFLGNLSTGQSTAVLTLDTAGYSSLTLSYSLYAILSQDGNANAAGGGAGDSFVVTAAGNTLSNYTFANYGGGNTQSYCGPGNASGTCSPQTSASAKDTLGYGAPGNGYDDATYVFSYTFTPTSPTTQVTFTSNDNEGVANEFYAIDNLSVTGTPIGTVSAAPEPGVWALMLGGVGLIGVALRSTAARRREDEAWHAAA